MTDTPNTSATAAPTVAVTPAAPAAPVESAPAAPVASNPAATNTPAPAAQTLLAVEPVAPTAPTEAPKADAPAPATAEAPKPNTPPEAAKTVPDAAKAATEAAKTQDESKSDEPAPPPSFEAFKLPEGVNLDAERLKQFTDVLGKFEQDTKAGHELVQKFGQEAVDFHLNELKAALDTQTKFYQEHWDKTVTTWKDEFLADTEIGGNKFQTTVDAARAFIRDYGGTPAQQKELRDIMQSSGLGNHKAVIRAFANATKAMAEGKPLTATKPVTAPKSRTATLYGSTH